MDIPYPIKTRKIGGSVGFIVPAQFAKQIGIAPGDLVSISLQKAGDVTNG